MKKSNLNVLNIFQVHTHLQQHEGRHYINLFPRFLRSILWFPKHTLCSSPMPFTHTPREKPGIVIFAVQSLENGSCQTNPHISSQILFGPSSPLHSPPRPGLQPAVTERQREPAQRERHTGGEKLNIELKE